MACDPTQFDTYAWALSLSQEIYTQRDEVCEGLSNFSEFFKLYLWNFIEKQYFFTYQLLYGANSEKRFRMKTKNNFRTNSKGVLSSTRQVLQKMFIDIHRKKITCLFSPLIRMVKMSKS